jgi:DNA-directed RNA polymerase subunit RPC12/RpoP
MTRGAVRYIFLAALSVFSLGLCIATVTLWVRSFWIADAYRPILDNDLIAYQSYRGRFHYVHVTEDRLQNSDRKYPPPGWSSVPAPQALLWQEWNGPSHDSYTSLGFGYTSSLRNFTISAIPYWALAALFAILPIQATPGFIRWLKRVPIHCHKCGKKIRGLATTCPRCGHKVIDTGAPPPPPMIDKTPPRPTKKIKAVVVKSATPDRTHPHPTGGNDKSVL